MTSTDPAMMLSTPGNNLVPSELSTERATLLAAIRSLMVAVTIGSVPSLLGVYRAPSGQTIRHLPDPRFDPQRRFSSLAGRATGATVGPADAP
jgi:hypothetical protein